MHKSHKIYNRVVYSFPYIRHNRNNRWLRNVPYINKTWNYGALLFMIFPALSCVLFYWFFSLSYSYKYTACMCRHFEYIWDSSCCIFPHFSMRKIILGVRMKTRGMDRKNFPHYAKIPILLRLLFDLINSIRKERKSFIFNFNIN